MKCPPLCRVGHSLPPALFATTQGTARRGGMGGGAGAGAYLKALDIANLIKIDGVMFDFAITIVVKSVSDQLRRRPAAT